MQDAVWLYRSYDRRPSSSKGPCRPSCREHADGFLEQSRELPYCSTTVDYRYRDRLLPRWIVTAGSGPLPVPRSSSSALRDNPQIRSIKRISTLKTQIISAAFLRRRPRRLRLGRKRHSPSRFCRSNRSRLGRPWLGQGCRPMPWIHDDIRETRSVGDARIRPPARPKPNPQRPHLLPARLIYEADQDKRQQITVTPSAYRAARPDSVSHMRRYWGPGSIMLVVRGRAKVEASLQRHQDPPFFLGPRRPRAQRSRARRPRGGKAEALITNRQYSLNAQLPVPLAW